MTPEQCDEVLKYYSGTDDNAYPEFVNRQRVGRQIVKEHDSAMKALMEQGWPRQALEKMPYVQVSALYGLLDFERGLDERRKLSNLPYWQLAPALERLDADREKSRKLHPNDPLFHAAADIFLPGKHCFIARSRTERKIAVLRCIEGIRLHSVGNGGKLPASLDEIKDVPIPVDPFTGKPFEYKRIGEMATVYSEGPERVIRGLEESLPRFTLL